MTNEWGQTNEGEAHGPRSRSFVCRPFACQFPRARDRLGFYDKRIRTNEWRGRRRAPITVIRLSTIRLSISPGLATGWVFMTNEWGQTNEGEEHGPRSRSFACRPFACQFPPRSRPVGFL